MITGGSGRLGKYITSELKKKTDLIYFAPTSSECDITNIDQTHKCIKSFNPNVIFHYAAYTDVKKSENGDYIRCMDVNVRGTLNLIKVCKENNIALVYVSTDAVFDGEKGY